YQSSPMSFFSALKIFRITSASNSHPGFIANISSSVMVRFLLHRSGELRKLRHRFHFDGWKVVMIVDYRQPPLQNFAGDFFGGFEDVPTFGHGANQRLRVIFVMSDFDEM